MLLLLLPYHFDLFQIFEGKGLVVFVLDQLHPPETTDAKRSDVGQIVQLDMVVLWWVKGVSEKV